MSRNTNFPKDPENTAHQLDSYPIDPSFDQYSQYLPKMSQNMQYHQHQPSYPHLGEEYQNGHMNFEQGYGYDMYPPQRPTSAPPNLEINSGNLFAFRTDYGHLFSQNSRGDENYAAFYDSYQDTRQNLPVPRGIYPTYNNLEGNNSSRQQHNDARQAPLHDLIRSENSYDEKDVQSLRDFDQSLLPSFISDNSSSSLNNELSNSNNNEDSKKEGNIISSVNESLFANASSSELGYDLWKHQSSDNFSMPIHNPTPIIPSNQAPDREFPSAFQRPPPGYYKQPQPPRPHSVSTMLNDPISANFQTTPYQEMRGRLTTSRTPPIHMDTMFANTHGSVHQPNAALFDAFSASTIPSKQYNVTPLASSHHHLLRAESPSLLEAQGIIFNKNDPFGGHQIPSSSSASNSNSIVSSSSGQAFHKRPDFGSNSSKQHPSTPNQTVCRYFLNGYCSRGDKCNFFHPVGDSFDSNHKSSRKSATSVKGRGGSTRGIGGGRGSRGGSNISSYQHHGYSDHSEHEYEEHSGYPSTKALYELGNSRSSTSSPAARYTSMEQVIGQIYSLSKDQHGCRFLQKKLEEGVPEYVDSIFNETFDNIVELMTDPFGNYLCQKLLEHCNDVQRLQIIQRVADELVNISRNMHGTRAVQKLIEFLNTEEQINLVVSALKDHVVTLIQDLNGNHVIQRCLHRLNETDNQFVYDSVAQNCVPVATHRHGCCVLQRCIDHASEHQKLQLVREITANSLQLVQDPYGNYVVQYVLDLPYLGVAFGLVRKFEGHIAELSTQKFSSNVIEKCLIVVDGEARSNMIRELLESDSLLALLQDPFGNYVVQTALTISDSDQHEALVEAIKPHLHILRNTPYGKRIQNKIMKENSAPTSPQGSHIGPSSASAAAASASPSAFSQARFSNSAFSANQNR